ncbi:MAG: ribonuclease HII [Candidatus Microsaccharimonas sp.]
MILGIDEVGRGPWAGPLVVGAVVLPNTHTIQGLTDSKKLSAKRRNELDTQIREQAIGWGLGWVHADELDEVGLPQALRLATIRAVEAVKAPYHEIIIDGTINFLKDTNKGQYVTTMAKADLLVPAVSAASIIAKVARDTYMAEQDRLYPDYGFASHVGYGTAKHQTALKQYGITPLHRKSFAPIAKLVGAKLPDIVKTVSTKQIGDTAEEKVAAVLESRGYIIEARNWKTKYCEIDIVAVKNNIRHFVEVKFRSSLAQGGGIAAITPTKLQQMYFAAELYDTTNGRLEGARLSVAYVNAKYDVEILEIA